MISELISTKYSANLKLTAGKMLIGQVNLKIIGSATFNVYKITQCIRAVGNQRLAAGRLLQGNSFRRN